MRRLMLAFAILRGVLLHTDLEAQSEQAFKNIRINAENKVSWTVEGDQVGAIYEIKEFRWNKWKKLGYVESQGTGTNEYSLNLDTQCDLYNVRVELKGSRRVRSQKIDSGYAPSISWNPNGASEIIFSGGTRYEIFSDGGKLVSKGCGDRIDIAELSRGIYYVNFGTTSAQFQRK